MLGLWEKAVQLKVQPHSLPDREYIAQSVQGSLLTGHCSQHLVCVKFLNAPHDPRRGALVSSSLWGEDAVRGLLRGAWLAVAGPGFPLMAPGPLPSSCSCDLLARLSCTLGPAACWGQVTDAVDPVGALSVWRTERVEGLAR